VFDIFLDLKKEREEKKENKRNTKQNKSNERGKDTLTRRKEGKRNEEKEKEKNLSNKIEKPLKINKRTSKIGWFIICFLFFGPGMKTVQPIENERKANQPMND
jgi:hypothetical protein